MDRESSTMFLVRVLHLKAQDPVSGSSSAHDDTFVVETFGGITLAHGFLSLRTLTHKSGTLRPCLF